MKQVVVTYKLKANKVEENEQLVKEVFRQLKESAPAGIRYATYKLADGVSFVHVATQETQEAHEFLLNLPAFKNFQAGIKERCEILPVANAVTEVGSYNSEQLIS
jgi:hypothetical protein